MKKDENDVEEHDSALHEKRGQPNLAISGELCDLGLQAAECGGDGPVCHRWRQ
jgi:hypothetical protein